MVLYAYSFTVGLVQEKLYSFEEKLRAKMKEQALLRFEFSEEFKENGRASRLQMHPGYQWRGGTEQNTSAVNLRLEGA